MTEELSTRAPKRTSVSKQLAQIAALEPGWYDGEGESLALCARWASSFLRTLVEEHGLPVPYLYPVPDGSIEAEWMLGRWEIGLTLNSRTGSALFSADNLDTDEHCEFEVVPYGVCGERRVVENLRKLAAISSHL